MSDLPGNRIDENAIKAWKITAALWGALLLLLPVFLFVNHYFYDGVPLIFPVVAAPVCIMLYALLVFLLPPFRWKRWYYDVNENSVDMLRGIIFSKRTVVPINRIQHVDTKQGPVYRKFKLSSISISTAATTHEIPALDEETAARLRNIISELVRQVKEDV